MPFCESCRSRFHGQPKVFVRDRDEDFETLVLCRQCRVQYPREQQYTPRTASRSGAR